MTIDYDDWPVGLRCLCRHDQICVKDQDGDYSVRACAFYLGKLPYAISTPGSCREGCDGYEADIDD